MSHVAPGVRARVSGTALALLLFAALAGSGCTQPGGGTPAGTAASGLPASDSDPRAPQAFIKPAELAAVLQGGGARPALLHVGFRVLYKGGAIPGSRYVGAGSTDEGIAGLKAAVQGLPKDGAIVIYCGCCPWDHCPNMRPAFDTLHALGYTNVRALYTPHNLETDWAQAGYPLEKPAD